MCPWDVGTNIFKEANVVRAFFFPSAGGKLIRQPPDEHIFPVIRSTTASELWSSVPLCAGDLLPLGVSEVQLRLRRVCIQERLAEFGPQFTSRILFKLNKTLNCQAALRPLLLRYVFGTFSNQMNWKSTQTWITKLSIHHWIISLNSCVNRRQTWAAQGQLECTSDTVIF